MDALVERFLKYVKKNTASDPDSGAHPSSPSQMDFARELADELKNVGLTDVKVDEHGYVMATLPPNISGAAPVIGFIAHMDTSPDFTAENVKPRIINNYDGGDISLNKEKGIRLSPSEFPKLLACKGQDLIVTDGTTLLGADDKAGIAEIVTAMEHLIANPSVKHGKIRICFTPDEEIGEGADFFNTTEFGADFAYTMDGGEPGIIAYENFNAAGAEVFTYGRNIHPGSAKGKMLNSAYIAMEFASMLPAAEKPEYTEGYEGFFHLHDITGSVEKSRLKYLIRDHDRQKFEAKKTAMINIAGYLNSKYGEGTVTIEIKDQYYNMLEKVLPVMKVVDLAKEAINSTGLEVATEPVRGGTDGARLSFMGLPTPNIFTGGENFHGKYEYTSITSMKKAVEVIIKIAELAAKQ